MFGFRRISLDVPHMNVYVCPAERMLILRLIKVTKRIQCAFI